MSKRALSFALLSLLAVNVQLAQADGFTRREVERTCRNQGRNTAIGIGLGVLTGILAGEAIDRPGNRLSTGERLLLAGVGGAFGGILGNAASCEDNVRYMRRVETYSDNWDYRRPGSGWNYDGVRGDIVQEFYSRDGRLCRTYYQQNRRGDTTVVTSCRREGAPWMHYHHAHVNRPPVVVARPVYVHPNPPPAVLPYLGPQPVQHQRPIVQPQPLPRPQGPIAQPPGQRVPPPRVILPPQPQPQPGPQQPQYGAPIFIPYGTR